MYTAIVRRRLAGVAIGLGAAVTYGCFRGDSLVGPAVGYRPPLADVASIALTPNSVSGPAGSQAQITANPEGESGQPVAADVVAWMSSDPQLATVTGSGMIRLVHHGKATITAVADGVTASVAADVEPSPAASLTVVPDSTLIQVGQQVQLLATAYDASGGIDSGAAVSWSSSNTGVASVTSGGLVTAIAVGTAVMTASSGGVTATASVEVTASAPVVVAVSVSPNSSSLYPGQTKQLAATLTDAAGDVVSGIPISWSTSNSGAASVSSSGLVTGKAIGSASITATAGGINGSATVNVVQPVVASVSISPKSVTIGVGQATQLTATAFDASGTPLNVGLSWSSSNTGVASVSGSGDVTGAAVGSATVTATAGGVSGTTAVTVEAGPPGGYHEPSGMATQINTGPISSTSIVTMFSPASPNSVGETSANLSVVPGGTGLRLTYPTTLTAGYSPVRFGMPVPSAGTGWYYQRMRIHFSSNWTNANNPLIKLCEPRTQQTGSPSGPNENHVVGGFVTAGPTQSFLTVLLQGPNNHFRDLFPQPSTMPQANLSDGNWHVLEVLFGPESTPGAGNGTYQAWVDGTQIASYTNVLWLAPGNNIGWPYLMFDPVYGGVQSSPPYTMYWDFDQLYVSTR